MIADTVTKWQRATVFGRLAAADGAGLVVGPAIVGTLAEQGLRAPFALVASLEARRHADSRRLEVFRDRRAVFSLADDERFLRVREPRCFHAFPLLS